MTIACRSAAMLGLYVNTVSSSGVTHLGDIRGKTDMASKALAVQKAVPNNEDDEFRFASYALFYKPKLALEENVPVLFRSESPWPTIQVDFVYSLGVSSSSTLRVGCGGPVEGISRIKHIRYFNDRDTR